MLIISWIQHINAPNAGSIRHDPGLQVVISTKAVPEHPALTVFVHPGHVLEYQTIE